MSKVKRNAMKAVFVFILMAICAFMFTSVMAWTGPNYCRHGEILGGLYHTGEVGVQPSHVDGGYHYARGWYTFNGGPAGEQRTNTELGTGPKDTRLLTNSSEYRDYWDFSDRPPVTWTGGADKVPKGANYWVASRGPVEK